MGWLWVPPEIALTGEAIRDKLVGLSSTTRTLVITTPSSGEFRVISIERKADGQIQIKYSDMPEA